ncbi:MAG TPA: hypothetical protein VIX73_38570 [Kofleriaceae bacterium]|jgi:hypothetical protein
MKRWLVGCLVFCAAACHPTPTPNPPGGSPAQLCKRTPTTGVAAPGGSLIHGAEFSMLMIESCGFDMTKLVDAARTCRDTGSCGIELDQGGVTLVNEAANSTWTTVSLGGGRAFQTKTGDRTWIGWDGSRDPVQVLTAVSQGAPGAPASCCPGCTPCDAGAGTPACPAGGSAPHVDKFPAPGFPDITGPAVCGCTAVCAAQGKGGMPADCECATLCHCK